MKEQLQEIVNSNSAVCASRSNCTKGIAPPANLMDAKVESADGTLRSYWMIIMEVRETCHKK